MLSISFIDVSAAYTNSHDEGILKGSSSIDKKSDKTSLKKRRIDTTKRIDPVISYDDNWDFKDYGISQNEKNSILISVNNWIDHIERGGDFVIGYNDIVEFQPSVINFIKYIISKDNKKNLSVILRDKEIDEKKLKEVLYNLAMLELKVDSILIDGCGIDDECIKYLVIFIQKTVKESNPIDIVIKNASISFASANELNRVVKLIGNCNLVIEKTSDKTQQVQNNNELNTNENKYDNISSDDQIDYDSLSPSFIDPEDPSRNQNSLYMMGDVNNQDKSVVTKNEELPVKVGK